MNLAKWDQYPNFSKSEFDCQETGLNEMTHEFMIKLQHLRTKYGHSMRITSGYRSPKHSIEAKKDKPGHHALGVACDIECRGQAAYRLMRLAMDCGFNGIGVSQKGGGRFIHLDIRESPMIWSY